MHQYFDVKKDSKTKQLVENIADFDCIVTQNENESLVLESNLIAKHKPKYNVLLRYASGYPYIVLTNEKNPHFIYTKDPSSFKNSNIYGPFAINKFNIFKFLNQLFPFRKCSPLKKEKCLYYDIGECLAPCINNIDTQIYAKLKKEVANFFRGDNKILLSSLENKIKDYNKDLNFEQSAKINELINDIKLLKSDSIKGGNIFNNAETDILGFYVYSKYITISLFSYKNKKIFSKHQQISEISTNDITDIIEVFLIQYYSTFNALPKKCIVDIDANNISTIFKDIKFGKPVKTNLIYKTILKNCEEFYKLNINSFKYKMDIINNGLAELSAIVNNETLKEINIFDISNFFNSEKIGGMVCAINGIFKKKLYKTYVMSNDIKSDFDAINYSVYKEYSSRIKKNMPMPNLIIVDGAVLQINAAIKALKLLNLNINVIGLAKNDYHQTEYICFNNQTIQLDKSTDLFKFLFNLQEEVHHHAISSFKKRNKY
jgi:excinuclease ABC subunit C